MIPSYQLLRLVMHRTKSKDTKNALTNHLLQFITAKERGNSLYFHYQQALKQIIIAIQILGY